MQIPASAPVAVSATTAAPLNSEQKKLKSACQQFESYFLDLMFKEMRKTVTPSDLTGDQSDQQQIFTGMLDQKIADTMSKQGNLGLSQMMYAQLAPTLGTTVSQSSAPEAPDAKAIKENIR
jgi:Rod binding domain-containing protein